METHQEEWEKKTATASLFRQISSHVVFVIITIVIILQHRDLNAYFQTQSVQEVFQGAEEDFQEVRGCNSLRERIRRILVFWFLLGLETSKTTHSMCIVFILIVVQITVYLILTSLSASEFQPTISTTFLNFRYALIAIVYVQQHNIMIHHFTRAKYSVIPQDKWCQLIVIGIGNYVLRSYLTLLTQ